MDQENNKHFIMSSWSKEPTNQLELSSPISCKANRLSEKGITKVGFSSSKNIANTVRKTASTLSKNQSSTRANDNMGANDEMLIFRQQTKGALVSPKCQQLQAARKVASAKKAYVRFDDYLDFNEENMRRSCKRLMNHLYSENSNSHSNENTIISSPCSSQTFALHLQPQPMVASTVPSLTLLKASEKSKCPKNQTGAPVKWRPNSTAVEATRNAISLSNKQNKAVDRKASSYSPAVTSGKSYLRSQYEKRQLRQMEMMNKMHQQQQLPAAPSKLQIAAGANIRRQHQQDLVARSHELSKRRFFEKLEHRESIKNLNLSTLTCKQLHKPTTVAPSLTPSNHFTTSSDSIDELHSTINLKEDQEVVKQKGLDADELILQVYQSIALGRVNSEMSNEAITHVGSVGTSKMKVKVKDEFSESEDLTVELIGFYTPSPQSPAEEERERLIDFSNRQETQKEEEVSDDGVKELEAYVEAADIKRAETKTEAANLKQPSFTFDQSTCETRVTACGTHEPAMRETGVEDTYATSSGLLVVKQAVLESSCSEMLQPFVRISSSHADADCERQTPTLSGRFELEALSQREQPLQATNKTNLKELVDDLTDNKVKLIEEVRSQHRQTIKSPSLEEISCTGTRNLALVQEVGDDQQKKSADSITLTISIKNPNSNNSNNNHDNSKSNMMNSETIEMTTLKSEQATNNGEVNLVVEDLALVEWHEQANEACGTSVRVKDHEAPEMALLLVEQSGGTDSNTTGTRDNTSSSAYPVQIQHQQSAAQAQQVASMRTTITNKKKIAMRHAQPEANKVCSVEAIVSSEKSTAKVDAAAKQVNEIQQQFEGLSMLVNATKDDQNAYANSRLSKRKLNKTHTENNVNYENGENQNELLCKNINASNTHYKNQLLESFTQNPILSTQKQSLNESALEEDEGTSSCSDSGFGASISVTSSFDGSPSLTVTAADITTSLICGSKNPQIRSKAITTCRDSDCKLCNNRSCFVHPQPLIIKNSDESSQHHDGYKELVGPDQAYPKNQVLVVENHNYDLTNTHKSDLKHKLDFINDTAFSTHDIEQDRDNFLGGYANLSNRKASPVEYATVHFNTTYNDFKKEPHQVDDNEGSIPGFSSISQSCSTTSAESGGFSSMPPAHIESAYINSYESREALADASSQERRRTSLLKKIGSLVSRAFTINSNSTSSATGTGVQSTTLKINKSPSLPSATVDVYELQDKNNASSSRLKYPLSTESNHNLVENESANAQQVGEMDLVILPTKHVNQQKLLQLHQPQERKLKTAQLRHDDRLSRETKKLSRKLKKHDSYFYNSTSSSLSSSLSSTRTHKEQRLEKSGSMFEELKSLISTSEHSTYYKKNSKNTSLIRETGTEFERNNYKASRTVKARIDIDCVSPKKIAHHEGKLGDQYSETTKANGPLSLLRVFTSNSLQNYTNKSTQDSIVSSSKTYREPSQCTINGETVDIDSAQQPANGFWGLVSQSHENAKTTKNRQTASSNSRVVGIRESGDSLIYSTSHLPQTNYRLHLLSEDSKQTLDKHQSLTMYRNVLQKYTKRRSYRHSHHHYHHHQHQTHQSVKPHISAHRSTKCVQSSKKSCHPHLTSSEDSVEGSCCCTFGEKASVWGQLIKINKMDGSQVVELQRSHGKSWGFFVARGAINNVKGIFISRMHDTTTSNSLTGLLSIGDRILAIDECPIEPDYDILRVNQMISKKSKIVLKVKPFKG